MKYLGPSSESTSDLPNVEARLAYVQDHAGGLPLLVTETGIGNIGLVEQKRFVTAHRAVGATVISGVQRDTNGVWRILGYTPDGQVIFKPVNSAVFTGIFDNVDTVVQ
jgi:hypothetical protein